MPTALAIQLALQYGPAILTEVEALFKKSTVTAAEAQAIFAGLQPYSAFGINPPPAPVKPS
jgi:hypothetical protein